MRSFLNLAPLPQVQGSFGPGLLAAGSGGSPPSRAHRARVRQGVGRIRRLGLEHRPARGHCSVGGQRRHHDAFHRFFSRGSWRRAISVGCCSRRIGCRRSRRTPGARRAACFGQNSHSGRDGISTQVGEWSIRAGAGGLSALARVGMMRPRPKVGATFDRDRAVARTHLREVRTRQDDVEWLGRVADQSRADADQVLARATQVRSAACVARGTSF